MTIAGHTFNSSDICTELTTTVIDGASVQHVCGRRWTDLMHCDETCISQHGYAHTSYLSAAEYSEIKRERERRERAYEAATRGVSGGGDYLPAEEPPVQVDTMMCLRPAKEEAKASYMASMHDLTDDPLMLELADSMFEGSWECNLALLELIAQC